MPFAVWFLNNYTKSTQYYVATLDYTSHVTSYSSVRSMQPVPGSAALYTDVAPHRHEPQLAPQWLYLVYRTDLLPEIGC